MAEYSFIPTQTTAEDENVLLLNSDRACRKGCVLHNNNSGVFRLKGSNNIYSRAIYRVTFNANIAVAEGGTVGEISVSLKEDGETVGNAVGVVTPAAVGEFFNVAFSTLVYVTCGCCATISIENTSVGTAIDVRNANLTIDRIA